MTGLKETFLPADYDLPPYQRHSSTSREAARSIAPRVKSLKARVLEFFQSHHDGATDEQMIESLGGSASTLRPRRIDLVNDGILIDSGRYAFTKSNRKATLWRLKRRSSPAEAATLLPL